MFVGIVLRGQSLAISAPEASTQLSHHVSMLSAKSESQRRDSLAFIANQLNSRSIKRALPQSSSSLLTRLLPLSLDNSQAVRTQLLKALRSFRMGEVDGHAEFILLHVRAGLTHIALPVRESALDILEWALQAIPSELVTCAGGWIKTLRYFALLLSWPVSQVGDAPRPVATGRSPKLIIKALGVLADYLIAGLQQDDNEDDTPPEGFLFPLTDTALHRIPRTANPYAHLGLFRSHRSDDNEALQDRVERQAAFKSLFQEVFDVQLAKVKTEGGELGRAAAGTATAIANSMADYEETKQYD